MPDAYLDIQRVAIIGAGVSGVAAAVHLKRAGIDITVYERGSKVGGVWVYDERLSIDAAYPSILPSTGDSPEYGTGEAVEKSRHDSPRSSILEGSEYDGGVKKDLSLSFAPPGPAYVALKNNVSTIEMELACQQWKPGTGEFVPHNVLADYIHSTAEDNGVLSSVSFNTRVNNVEKVDDLWRLYIAKLVTAKGGDVVENSTETFDAVVVASGHYHACNIPDISGLSQWKERFPGRVRHSKLYRKPDEFKGQNVLLIGAGVSSLDIARDLGGYARSVYQSSRGGPHDVPSHLLADNGARIGGIQSFDSLASSAHLTPGEAIPGTITLLDGRKLCDIHQVIVCTGYHVSFPFMRQHHSNGVRPEDATEDVLVTNGQQTHNLHKDIWYIPDPTLAFIGVPYHVATFSLFEFQTMAVAAVFSGKVPLPNKQNMRGEYNARIARKGAGRTFHSLKGIGEEVGYVRELTEMVDCYAAGSMTGHSEKWLEAYARRRTRQEAIFGHVRDPALDERVVALMAGCR